MGIEHLPELSALATKNLLKDPENKKMMDAGELILVTGDGRKGYAEEGTTSVGFNLTLQVPMMQFMLALVPLYAHFWALLTIDHAPGAD